MTELLVRVSGRGVGGVGESRGVEGQKLDLTS